ncbi:hypothetical protein PoB_007533200 [Plakobranchus ocellatus]|uniref:Uncharacterized protein n=1 Tax=Plakobranchus ocellatus TaxID=259542 RepID=A0AAV4DWY8_9GAST|nr:hypothetical protein PoB_007533200 [Plakobranchus ocellatus]
MQKDVETLGDYTRCRRTWRHEEIIQDAGMQKDVETLGDYTRCRRTWRQKEIIQDAGMQKDVETQGHFSECETQGHYTGELNGTTAAEAQGSVMWIKVKTLI